MHDRRVNGEILIFGNQGALYMNAMTWWDHGTQSLWSQPWGTALVGPLEGTALTLIPASIVPWSTWLGEHPETTVVANDLDSSRFGRARGVDNFVIGVALEDAATAYHYKLASSRRVINDRVGPHPLVVFVDPNTRDIKVYLRRIGAASPDAPTPAELRFELVEGGRIVDLETGSVWDTMRGVAIEGALKGTLLQQIPYVTSFEWAWLDFFHHTRLYEED